MSAKTLKKVDLAKSVSAGLPVDQRSTGGSTPAGASMLSDYADQDRLVTAVDVEDLRDWKTGMREESWQFSIAGFFASGATWLAIERAATIGFSDKLFWFCVVVVLASAVVAYFGYKQLGRRQLRIDRYIRKAEANRPKPAANEASL